MKFSSTFSAYFSSWSLREYVFVVAAFAASLSPFFRAFSWRVIFTNCWVRVDAPCTSPPCRLEIIARLKPRTSSPPCS